MKALIQNLASICFWLFFWVLLLPDLAFAAREPEECDDGEYCEWWGGGAGFSLSLDTTGIGAGLSLGLLQHNNAMGFRFYDLHVGYIRDLNINGDGIDRSHSYMELDTGYIGVASARLGVGANAGVEGSVGGQATLYLGIIAGFAYFQYQGPNGSHSGMGVVGFQFFFIQ